MPADPGPPDAAPVDGVGPGQAPFGRERPVEVGESWLRRAVRRQPADVVASSEPHACAGRTHSRLADGRLLCWRPSEPTGLPLAIDAELAGQAVPRALAGRAETGDPAVFWPLWTRAEVRAKLHGIPIAAWLRMVDWPADADVGAPLEVVTVVRAGVVVSYGVRAPVDPPVT